MFEDFITLIQGIWILIQLFWVFSAGYFTFLISRKIFNEIDERIPIEFSLIPTVLICAWVFNIVGALTILAVTSLIILAVLGVFSIPSVIILSRFLKIDTKKRKIVVGG